MLVGEFATWIRVDCFDRTECRSIPELVNRCYGMNEHADGVPAVDAEGSLANKAGSGLDRSLARIRRLEALDLRNCRSSVSVEAIGAQALGESGRQTNVVGVGGEKDQIRAIKTDVPH